MNIFRRSGDMSHAVAIVLLILQLYRAKNARGISVKTQELRLLVFVTRYLDLFTTFYSLYNSILKIAYIVATIGILAMIKTDPIKSVYNSDQDSFPHWKFAVAPCAVIAFLTHLIVTGFARFNIMELLWTFSIYLESIAILPQLLVVQKYRIVENLTGKFILFLGLYRFFYLINWIYRSYHEPRYRHHFVVYICGIVQTLLYADFFYQYCQISRKCGCGSGMRHGDGEDEDDDTGLIFEVAGIAPKINTAGATEHLLSSIGQDFENGDSELRSRVQDGNIL